MKLYDWIILIMIGALVGGAYFVAQNTAADPTYGDSHDVVFDATQLLILGAAFAVYALLFRGKASGFRSAAAGSILLFLLSQVLELFARYLLFTGWADEGRDIANREQLYGVAAWFSDGIAVLSALLFMGLALAAALRRLTAKGAA